MFSSRQLFRFGSKPVVPNPELDAEKPPLWMRILCNEESGVDGYEHHVKQRVGYFSHVGDEPAKSTPMQIPPTWFDLSAFRACVEPGMAMGPSAETSMSCAGRSPQDQLPSSLGPKGPETPH